MSAMPITVRSGWNRRNETPNQIIVIAVFIRLCLKPIHEITQQTSLLLSGTSTKPCSEVSGPVLREARLRGRALTETITTQVQIIPLCGTTGPALITTHCREGISGSTSAAPPSIRAVASNCASRPSRRAGPSRRERRPGPRRAGSIATNRRMTASGNGPLSRPSAISSIPSASPRVLRASRPSVRAIRLARIRPRTRRSVSSVFQSQRIFALRSMRRRSILQELPARNPGPGGYSSRRLDVEKPAL